MILYTYCKSNFSQTKRLTVQIALALLSFSSPFFLCNTSWSQSTTHTQILTQNQEKENEIPENVKSKLREINNALQKYNSQDSLNKDKNRAISIFRDNLQHSNKDVRIHALNALSAIGTGADDALNDLINMLKTDKDRDVLSSGILAIRSINAGPAISELIHVYRDEQQDLQVRLLAGGAIKTAGYTEQTKEFIPWLLDLLQERNVANNKLRINAAEILSQILHKVQPEEYPPNTVQILQNALKDPAWRVRGYAAYTLGNIGIHAKSSVNQLIEAYDKELNGTMRKSAVQALGNIGKVDDEKALEILPILSKVLQKEKPYHYVHTSATEALRKVAGRLQTAANNNRLKTKELNKAILELEKAIPSLKPENKTNIQNSLDELKRHQVINQIVKNPSVWGIGTYLVLLFGIFWLRPLWLLKIDKALKSVGTFKLPVIDKEISLSWLLLMLKYRPRVLDAWVEAHLKTAQEAFENKNTVRDRNVYIPIPVICNGKTDAELTGKDLHLTFNKHQACLLIQGEGGVGKTSLACEISRWAMSDNQAERLCKHRMLPVLIEEELEMSEDIEIQASSSNKPPSIVALIEAIQGQLNNLIDGMDPISEELLERLLRERRILVIVDHLSEMSESTRKAIRPDSPDFSINALIVTSRLEEKLGQVTKTTLKPLRIQGNRLSSFMEAYLTQANKRDLFTDSEFFQACSRLSQMVGERNITALLAKLYADQLIATKVEEIQQIPLQTPDNIPELMLWYLNELNRGVTEGNKLSDRTVHQDAKIIAWECLNQTLRPTTAKRDATLAALRGDDAEDRLKYLEKRLRLIETIGAARDNIRFALDPLAEYLAAMYLLNLCQTNKHFWHEFWPQVTTMGNEKDSIAGFLLALRDCCATLGQGTSLSQLIIKQLNQFLDSPLDVHQYAAPFNLNC